MLKIVNYDNKYFKKWNDFVKNSKNGTFLFDRNYMEYHSDRFKDFSLLVFEKDILVALLPANIVNTEVISHGGLTYGGFIYDHTMRTEKMINIFGKTLEYLKSVGVSKFVYKAVPHIYHKIPAEEDLYALFRYDFKLYRRDVSSTINMRTSNIKGKKRNGWKRAMELGMYLESTDDSSYIIEIVNKNLTEKYHKKAVHSAYEMNLLKSRFKNNIIFLNLVFENNIEGGAILYLCNNVVHAQYVTTTYKAKINRGLDFIVVSIFDMYKNKYEWFDFGISTENNGCYLNSSLIKSKEEFNMSAVCYDFYEKYI